MARPRMRPSFRVEVACRGDAVVRAFRTELDAREGEVEGLLTARQCTLAVPADGRRFWTPALDLMFSEVRDADAPRVQVWGTFSPRAAIWTAFVFTIGTLVVASIFASMYGLAQLALGHWPTALLVPAVSAGLVVVLYGAALVGQGLSIADMYQLRAFVDDCLRRAEADAPSEPG